jgi:hypothetical protein
MSVNDLNRDLNGLNPLAYLGVNPRTPPLLVTEPRNPTANDYIRFPLGTLWLVPPTDDVFILTSKVNNQATWTQLSVGGGGGTGITWSVENSSLTAAINCGYIANGAGTVIITLPLISPAGSIFKVTGINNATGWQIQCAAGQIIHFGSQDTTVGGTLTCTAKRDAIEIVCVVANTEFQVLSTTGNITIA